MLVVKKNYWVLLLCLVLMSIKGYSQRKDFAALIKENFAFANSQYKLLMKNVEADKLPQTYDAKQKKLVSYDRKWWCSGFYPGTLWYIYEQTSDTTILREAKRTLEVIRPNEFFTENHDLGFMMFCSFGNAYAIAKDTAYKSILLQSAASLASRYRPGIPAIQSWKKSTRFNCPVIIDNMMNLELLEWAAQNGGNQFFDTIAVNHANTTIQNHFRKDYSSYHVIDYDQNTGKVLQKKTFQGYSDSSSWARGQAWGVYGYTMMYRFTRNEKYLNQARNIAAYILNHPRLPKDMIPYWDYSDPAIPNVPRDASAAAVTASGLLELGRYTQGDERKKYVTAAETILQSLSGPAYRAKAGENGGFILLHSTGALPFKSEVDVPLIYADYYFLEALKRYKDWYLNEQPALLPVPRQYHAQQAQPFMLSAKTAISLQHAGFLEAASVFRQYVQQWKGITLKLMKGKQTASNVIEIQYAPQQDTAAYNLTISSGKIVVRAASRSGIGNALASLLQLVLTAGKGSSAALAACEIADVPAYPWRGFMLDEARHFFGKAEVKKLLDQMYLFKLNRFHWHLTDEPAWRLAIEKYPRLTSVGAKGSFSDATAAPRYYTKQEVREIVQYAAARNITVIPEIDMPGHATAANKAYPEFSGGGSQKHPEFTFNPGKEKVYGYLTDILKETLTLFPSGMIHIGGDEVSFGNEKWDTDKDIQRLKQKQGLPDNLAVEHYFLRRMADSVRKLNATVLGWDEITGAGLHEDSTIIFWWRHDKPEELQKALAKGYKVVLCPRVPYYFDFVQHERDSVGRRWRRTFGSSLDALAFSVDALVAPQYQKQILGMQGNLWTETVKTRERLEYLVFPRLVALASASWNPVADSYNQFVQQVSKFYPLWKQLNMAYFDLSHPANTKEVTDLTNKVKYLDN